MRLSLYSCVCVHPFLFLNFSVFVRFMKYTAQKMFRVTYPQFKMRQKTNKLSVHSKRETLLYYLWVNLKLRNLFGLAAACALLIKKNHANLTGTHCILSRPLRKIPDPDLTLHKNPDSNPSSYSICQNFAPQKNIEIIVRFSVNIESNLCMVTKHMNICKYYVSIKLCPMTI